MLLLFSNSFIRDQSFTVLFVCCHKKKKKNYAQQHCCSVLKLVHPREVHPIASQDSITHQPNHTLLFASLPAHLMAPQTMCVIPKTAKKALTTETNQCNAKREVDRDRQHCYSSSQHCLSPAISRGIYSRCARCALHTLNQKEKFIFIILISIFSNKWEKNVLDCF